MPANAQLTADYAGPVADSSVVALTQATDATVAKKTKLTPFRDDKYVVQWTAEVVPANLSPGQTGLIRFTAKPDQGFHIYKVAIDDSESSTNFVVTGKDGLLTGQPVADKEVISQSILPSLPPVNYYKGAVTFELPIKAPDNATVGTKTIDGMIAYQACTDNSCHKPVALKFAAQVNVGNADATVKPITFASAKSADALDAAAETKWVDPVKADDSAQSSEPDDDPVVSAGGPSSVAPAGPESSFAIMLGFAFLGGLILNVMPCVLPVVGLKIMGFVSQAGEDRRRVLVLNLVYVLGIMSIFAVLAAVAAVSKFGWGEQFTYFEVKLGLTILMFALALSYLGVWEIPAPGMAGGRKSTELQNREGLVGAFSERCFRNHPVHTL